MTIYVVVGASGSYEDKTEWLVVAYRSENEALEHAEKAENRFKELFKKQKGDYYNIPRGTNEFDLKMEAHDDDVRYDVYPIELK